MNKNSGKSAVIISTIITKFQLVLGIIILILFGMAFCGTTFLNDEVDSTLCIIEILFLFIGIMLIIQSKRNNKLIKLFKNYVSFLSENQRHSLDDLATVTNMPVNAVKSNVLIMIKKGYFANAHINENTNCVVFGNERPVMQSATIECAASNEPREKEASYKTVVCKGCGATNKIKAGTVGECEFCGSKLE